MNTVAAPTGFDPSGRLLFDAKEHRYYLDAREHRRELISVTKVFEEVLAGTLGEEYWTDRARERGSHLHNAILYLTQNDLDERSIHPDLQPFMGGVHKMFEDENPEVLHAEQPVYDEALGYGGTFDLLCRLRGARRSNAPNVLDLLDAKSGSVPYTVGYQTAAYKRPIQLVYPGFVIRRWAWHLKSDGTYRLDEISRWPDARDHEKDFCSLLRSAQIRRRHL